MMIYRKGELVIVLTENLLGRVCFVGNIDKDSYPFAIATYSEEGINILLCNQEELKLANHFNDLIEAQKFKNLERKFRNYL